MTKPNKSNQKNNPKIEGIVIASPSAGDMKIFDLLPPELAAMIQKDISRGDSDFKNPSETEQLEVVPVKNFDFKMMNTSQDLKELTKKLKKSKRKNYGILLYGVSGAGKSLYGKYLAQELKMPFIKKRASDLINKFVGDTEKAIRDAFKEAKEKKAILLFDEADSFLFDRRFAQRDFECASVNEILTQMEDHPYPFLMTTNLKEKIDPASMRRILFKIEYKYMESEHIKAGIKTYFGRQYKLTDDQLSQLKYITAGDFKVVKDKIEILDDNKCTNELIFNYLLKEQEEKNIIESSKSIKL